MSSLNNETQCIYKFRQRIKEKTIEVQEEFKKIKGDSVKLKILKNKYPNLTRRSKKSKNYINKKTKKLYFYPLIKEWFDILKDEFSEEDQITIYKNVVEKIKGLYKHAQAMKTGICNQRIVHTMKSQEKTITICISKNTLEANEQWFRRLLAEIQKRYPTKSLADLVMIVSSKKVKNNVTHCRTIDNAWSKLSVENEFKVVFCCSNATRINDILDLTTKYKNLVHTLIKNIRIIHDEAHNSKEGIPPNRDVIENILLDTNVLSYCPVTASAFVKDKGIADEENPLWNIKNLKKNGINFTEFDKIKSTSKNYSSCTDAIKLNCEELKKSSKWKSIAETRISKELYKKVHSDDISKLSKYGVARKKTEIKRFYDQTSSYYKGGNYKWIEDLDKHKHIYDKIIAGGEIKKKILETVLVDLYVNRKRELEFCSFMKQDKEKEAIENGLNYLNMNKLTNSNFYKSKEFGLYIISTPNRKIITRFLAEKALEMKYSKPMKKRIKKKIRKRMDLNPIVLAIYGNEGNKYHLLYDGNDECVDDIMVDGEFNEKLLKLKRHLENNKVNTNRPLMIFGNYNPCGESISFAHTDYGLVHAVLSCTSQGVYQDYQVGCRGNAVNNHFVKKFGTDWKFPEKFLVGTKEFIENVMEGERQNDNQVEDYLACQEDQSDKEIQINLDCKKREEEFENGTVAIPIKVTISHDCSKFPEILAIMNNQKKTQEQKNDFIKILKEMYDDEDEFCDIDDKTGKFDWSKQSLNQFRCYQEEHIAKNYRFEKYQKNHEMKFPYINNKGKIKPNQCEILTCKDNYKLKKKGDKTYKNLKNTWWIGYKY